MGQDNDMDLSKHISEYENQQFPSSEETIKNNATVLYKRKKFFLGELRHSLKFLGFVVIIIVYLKDISMLRLLGRGFSQYTLSNPYPAAHMYSEESKKGLSKFLLMSVISVNGFCLFMHLVFGPYTTSPSGNQYLHGGMTVEFIGERVPWGRIELLVYDGVIFIVQLLLHNLMCFIDDSKVLEVKPVAKPVISPENNHWAQADFNNSPSTSDGYNGDVNLVTIDIIKDIRTVMSYENRFSMYDGSLGMDIDMEANGAHRIPGSFTNG